MINFKSLVDVNKKLRGSSTAIHTATKNGAYDIEQFRAGTGAHL